MPTRPLVAALTALAACAYPTDPPPKATPETADTAAGPWLEPGFEAGLDEVLLVRLMDHQHFHVEALDRDAGLVLAVNVPADEAWAAELAASPAAKGLVFVGRRDPIAFDCQDDGGFHDYAYAHDGTVSATLAEAGGTVALDAVTFDIDGTSVAVSLTLDVPRSSEDCYPD